mgnify:CR=1 FL=1
MVRSEYVGFSGSEKSYWQKSFLQTQLELLQIVDNLAKFKILRRDEFLLKIGMKSKIDETLEIISDVESKMPKTNFSFKTSEERKIERKTNEELGLHGEIDSIRKKIEDLRNQI